MKMGDKDVSQFISEALEEMGKTVVILQVLGTMLQDEKQQEKKPRKKVRQPPKYV